MSKNKLNPRQQTEVRMTVLLGIIQQLMTTRQNRLFADRELNLSQFGLLNHFTHDPNDPASLSNDTVTCIMKDKQGLLWIGTHGGLKFGRKVKSAKIRVVAIWSTRRLRNSSVLGSAQ